MSTPAFVRSGDLIRMAKVAKSQGVTVWIEIDGRRVGVSPAGTDSNSPVDNDDRSPESFTSLADWQKWRDRKRDREAQGNS